MIKIEANTQGLEQAIKLLRNTPKKLNLAQRSALSRTVSHMKTRLAQLGNEKYYAKSSEIKKSLSVKTGYNLGQVISRGKKKSIADYYLSPRKQKLGRRQGKLRGAVKRDGIKSLGKAFLVPLGGKYYPYVRVGKGRWDIKRLISPAIPQILGNQEITERLTGETLKFYNQRLNHEIMRQLGIFTV